MTAVDGSFGLPSAGPLVTLKVIEYASIGPAPYAGMMLADLGAEIAQHYGLKDRNGKQPPTYREMLGEPRKQHPARVY